jgi:hypothetical protein
MSAVERQHWEAKAREANKYYYDVKARRDERKKANSANTTSGYGVFVSQHYAAACAAPDLAGLDGRKRTTEGMRRVAAAWKALSKSDKEFYKAKADRARELAKL